MAVETSDLLICCELEAGGPRLDVKLNHRVPGGIGGQGGAVREEQLVGAGLSTAAG